MHARRLKLLGVIGTMALSAACVAPSRIQGGQQGKDLIAARHSLDAAFAARNFSSYMDIAAEKVSMSGPAWRTAGRDQLKQGFVSLTTRRPDVTMVHVTDELRMFDDVGYENGSWREVWQQPDGLTVLTGKYTALWRLVQSRWMLEAEVFVPLSCKGSNYCNAG